MPAPGNHDQVEHVGLFMFQNAAERIALKHRASALDQHIPR